MRTTVDYIAPDKDYPVHAQEVFEAMAAFTGDHRYEEVYHQIAETREGGNVNMCEVLDRMEAKGKAEGQSLILLLIAKLNELGRGDEIAELPSHPERVEKLCNEFGIA